MVRVSRAIAIGMLAICSIQTASSQELQVYFRTECPVTGVTAKLAPEAAALLAPILAAIASKALEGIVDNGIDALMKTLKPEVKTIPTQQNVGGFYYGKRVNPDIGCMVAIVSNSVSPAKAKPSLPFSDEFATNSNGLKQFTSGLYFVGAPHFYLEASLVQSDDASAISWVPQYVYGGKFTIDSWFAGSSRDAALTVQFTSPSGAKLAEYSFKFLDVAFPMERGPAQLGSMVSAWSPMPSLEDGRSKTSSGADRLNRPFTLTANYVETPKPNQLTTILVGAVESQKGEIKTIILDTVDPEKRKKKESEAVSTARKAITDYNTNWTAYNKDCGAPVADKAALAACQLAYMDLKVAEDAAKAAVKLDEFKQIDLPTLPAAPKLKT